MPNEQFSITQPGTWFNVPTTLYPRMTIGEPFIQYDQTDLAVEKELPPPSPHTPDVNAVVPTSMPITVAVSAEADTLKQHAALCNKLGIYSTAAADISRTEFEQALSEWGLRQYDRKQVAAYLTSQYGPPREGRSGRPAQATWGYRPLMAQDAYNLGAQYITANGVVCNGGTVTSYVKPVPLPVLLTVEKIAERFPKAEFFVSDELTVTEVKDPFLLVRHAGKDYIIERWDEPGYTEK